MGEIISSDYLQKKGKIVLIFASNNAYFFSNVSCSTSVSPIIQVSKKVAKIKISELPEIFPKNFVFPTTTSGYYENLFLLATLHVENVLSNVTTGKFI